MVDRQRRGHFAQRPRLDDGIRVQQQQVHAAGNRFLDRAVHGAHEAQVLAIDLDAAGELRFGQRQHAGELGSKRGVAGAVDVEDRARVESTQFGGAGDQ